MPQPTTTTTEPGQPAAQTTEAPHAGAPLTLEQAVQRIAELEQQIEAQRAEDKARHIGEAAASLAKRFADALASNLTGPIAEKICELEALAPPGASFVQFLEDVRQCRSADDFGYIASGSDLPVDLVLEMIEEDAKKEFAQTAEQIALDQAQAAKESAA